jgi:anti-anti-sigma regulatory factor
MKIHIDNISQLAVVECAGKIAGRDAAVTLRDAVLSRANAAVIVVDLTEVDTVERAGLEMLLFVGRWAHARNIRLKLFNPSRQILHRLQRSGLLCELEFATLEEVIVLVANCDPFFAMAS